MDLSLFRRGFPLPSVYRASNVTRVRLRITTVKTMSVVTTVTMTVVIMATVVPSPKLGHLVGQIGI